MKETGRRAGTGMHAAVLIWTALQRWPTGGISWEGGGKTKGSDLAVAGLSEGMVYDPVYHALKGGHAGSFEVPDHPAGSLQTCGRWTFMLLAAVIQYLSTYWCVFFEGGTLRNIFMPHRAPTRSSPRLSGWLALWCFDVGVPLRILNRKK